MKTLKTALSVLFSVAKAGVVFGSIYAATIALMFAWEQIISGYGASIPYRILLGLLFAAVIALQITQDRAAKKHKAERKGAALDDGNNGESIVH